MKLIVNFAEIIIRIMVFFNKAYIHIALLFLILFPFSMQVYSQEQAGKSLIYPLLESNDFQAPDLIEYPDTVILYSPYLPIVFDGNHLNILNHQLTPECPLTKPLFPPVLYATHRLFADVHHKNNINRKAYDCLIVNNIDQIKYTVADFAGKVEPLEQMPSNIFHFLFKIDNDFLQNKDTKTKPSRFQPKRKYWIYNGNHRIQLSQNYISENWYNGSAKFLNLQNMHKLFFNYQKNKFQNNNTFELRLNVYTNPNDTLRIYRIADDLARLYSDFGLQAIHHWYYSSNIEIKTQVFNNFTQNTSQLLASAFSPLYVNIGFLGMRYQIDKTFPKTKGKILKFNMDISPLSIQYVTVFNKDIDQTRFGIEKEKQHLTNLGSTINAGLEVNFNRNIKFSSRFKYFTNYKYMMGESENTLNMPINRYFSTSIYLYVRYDNNKQLVKNPTWGYFQFNELLSFGFNYNW